MNPLITWTRYVVCWYSPVTQRLLRFPHCLAGGGFRLRADAEEYLKDNVGWMPDGRVETEQCQRYTPGYSYAAGRAHHIQQSRDLLLLWKHPAGSVYRTGVTAPPFERKRLASLASLLNELFLASYQAQHRVAEISDGVAVPRATWAEPVDGRHPFWKQPLEVQQAVLNGSGVHGLPAPEPAKNLELPVGFGERSMLL